MRSAGELTCERRSNENVCKAVAIHVTGGRDPKAKSARFSEWIVIAGREHRRVASVEIDPAEPMNQLVLVVYGGWNQTTASTQALTRVNAGVTDFFYKATQGYEGYSHAQDEGVFKCSTDMDCLLNQAFWAEILAPYHGL